MKIANVYFDTEFTELSLRGKLISIGMVTDDDAIFYAEFNDYDKESCSDWVKENVIKNLIYTGKEFNNKLCKVDPSVIIYGDSTAIKESLISWFEELLEKTGSDSIQFISDVCHYDFVFLINLFGTAFDLPDYICPACYDINQRIASDFYYTNNLKDAFNISREDLIKEYRLMPFEENKHNALYDAKIIKELYNLYK